MVQVIIDWFPTSIEAGYKQMRYSERGRISFCKDKERKQWCGRPNMSTGTGRYILCDELHQWFREVDPSYAQHVRLQKQWIVADAALRRSTADRCAFVLDFLSPGLATMFTVVWGRHTDRG